MQERVKRPSRLVQSMARWAITLGAAGTIVGATAMYGVLLRQELVSSKHSLLMLSAVLLSVAFMLAPFVRRTFGLATAKRKPTVQRTLLDEMREQPRPPEGEPLVESAVQSESEPAVPEAEPAPTYSSLAARLVTTAYVVFGVTLLTIVWALQTD
jgi:hypothetical protein